MTTSGSFAALELLDQECVLQFPQTSAKRCGMCRFRKSFVVMYSGTENFSNLRIDFSASGRHRDLCKDLHTVNFIITSYSDDSARKQCPDIDAHILFAEFWRLRSVQRGLNNLP